jgi:S-adenosylmethionine decarboxylase
MSSLSAAPLGMHVLLDLHGVPGAVLTDCPLIEQVLLDAAAVAGARVLGSRFHPFGPGQGITGVLLLAESHISIHTWPEHGYAAVDVFMCGDARPMIAIALIRDRLGAARSSVRECPRGTVESAGFHV